MTGALAALLLLACAMLYPTTPVAVTVVVLFAGGLARSMQFGVLNTLSFADVPPALISGANSLAAVVQQMGIGLGVAVGAAGCTWRRRCEAAGRWCCRISTRRSC